MIELPQLKLYLLKRQTLKHVEIVKASEKPTKDTSLQRPRYVAFPEPSTQSNTIKNLRQGMCQLKCLITMSYFYNVEKVMFSKTLTETITISVLIKVNLLFNHAFTNRKMKRNI